MASLEMIDFKTLDRRVIKNEFYTYKDSENSLAVLFPGGNYSCDKPLLYYARKAAIQAGNDVLCISYSKKISKENIESKNVEIIAAEVEKVISTAMKKQYKNIYFISKSIGTEVAGCIAKKLGYENIKLLFLTPTTGTIKHILKAKCTVITGNSDGLFPKENIDKLAVLNHIQLKVIDGGNHSLEIKDDIDKSIQVMVEIAKIYETFF